jgi:glycerate 2-kinase
MSGSAGPLRRDALRIWQAGVDAVRSDKLVHDALWVDGRSLVAGDDEFSLDAIQRIAVVGAGKAGAGMAAAVEQVLGPCLLAEKHVTGWINVPADCIAGDRDADNHKPPRHIHLHPARPAGVNEPTAAGVEGAEAILRLVDSLGPHDLCLCLLSGGGSALLPAPAEGITLDDKLAVTRFLSAAGANIEQLNTVRRQLSRIKGGQLARTCRAGSLVSLVISDVLGDPLDVIASGPTVPNRSTAADAQEILDRFDAQRAGISPRVFNLLRRKPLAPPPSPGCRVVNRIIGNNAKAVDASGEEAKRLGYDPALLSATQSEGPAEEVGIHLARMALRMRSTSGPNCLVSGGEPVVKLVEASRRGQGGRNQQLVLAALDALHNDVRDMVILSGGTDGEDGPTDAAGAVLDANLVADVPRIGLDCRAFLRRNDAYPCLERLEALVKTGPTHTNVGDLRVVVADAPLD